MKAGEPFVESTEQSAPFDFSELFHAHYARIARVIARVVQDRARAEELAAEVFWKLWRNPGMKSGNSAVYQAIEQGAIRRRWSRDPRVATA